MVAGGLVMSEAGGGGKLRPLRLQTSGGGVLATGRARWPLAARGGAARLPRLSPPHLSPAPPRGAGPNAAESVRYQPPACCGDGRGPGPALQPGWKRLGRRQARVGQLRGGCRAASAPAGVPAARGAGLVQRGRLGSAASI